MKLYHVYDIEWDTDGHAVELPDSIYVRAESEDEIADYLLDHFGFCVFKFDHETIKG